MGNRFPCCRRNVLPVMVPRCWRFALSARAIMAESYDGGQYLVHWEVKEDQSEFVMEPHITESAAVVSFTVQRGNKMEEEVRRCLSKDQPEFFEKHCGNRNVIGHGLEHLHFRLRGQFSLEGQLELHQVGKRTRVLGMSSLGCEVI